MEETQIVEDLEASLQRELDTLPGNVNEAENFTIFRVPHDIFQSKKNLFEPSVISIGPFHRGREHFRASEEQKKRFLRDFLSRKDDISLGLCISEMKSLETRTRRCYSEAFDDLDSDTFVKMMMLDGCFVLEYFLLASEGNWDSIFEVGWNSHFINRDLVLQENQIPFFIVDKLYELIGFDRDHRMYFVKYIANYFLPRDSIIPAPRAEIPASSVPYTRANLEFQFRDPIIIVDPPTEFHHLVHLCYDYLVSNPEEPVVLSSKLFDLTAMFNANRIKGFLHRFLSRVLKRRSPHSTSGSSSESSSKRSSEPLRNSTGNLSSMVIPSATELKEAGLKFKPKSNPKHVLDISFEYGVLQIPKLQITDITKPVFANLIAFEHSKYGKKNKPFTSFVYFLDNLVNTQNDVIILQQCGIVENWLSSEEELTHFINQVTEGSVLGEGHYLAKLNRAVNGYIGSSWNRQRAKLIRDYFSSPWAAISVVAAFILLCLTCIQTFFAVYAYIFPPSS